MMEADVYICPRCKSKGFQKDYPEMWCPQCGCREPLIDFPISWDFHRALCVQYGKPDPGPAEPTGHTIEDPVNRSIDLKTGINRSLDRPYNQQEQIQQLKAQLNYLQNKINEHIDLSARRLRGRY
jgi:transcription initiation factor TFIIIB Brf1 subunit/transcription initiation factor TFIIB